MLPNSSAASFYRRDRMTLMHKQKIHILIDLIIKHLKQFKGYPYEDYGNYYDDFVDGRGF